MKTNPYKKLLKTASLLVAVLFSLTVSAQNASDKFYATSTAGITKNQGYKWEGISSVEESEVNASFSPTGCITLSTTVTDVVCSNDNNGAFTVTVTGGVAPYAYETIGSDYNPVLSNSSITTYSNLGAGTYTILVTSSDGCNASIAATINYVNISPTISTSGATGLCTPSQTTIITASGANTYTWSTGPNTASVIATAPNYVEEINFFYVQGTSINGCISEKKEVDVYLSYYSVVTDPSQTVCLGQSAVLNAYFANTYTWNPGGFTGASIVVTPSVTTTYTVTGTGGCTVSESTETVFIGSGDPPIVHISGSPTICANGMATYTASGASSYQWLNGGNTNTIGISGEGVPVGEGLTLTVIGTSSSGCPDTASFNVSNIGPFYTFPENFEYAGFICSGSSYTINTTVYPPASTYTWSPNLIGLSPVVSPPLTTTYSLSVSYSGCTVNDTFRLTVKPTPTITLVSPINICASDNYTITPVLNGIKAGTIYNWSPATGLSRTDTSTTIVNITSNQSYTLTATNIYNGVFVDGPIRPQTVCQQSQSININVLPTPTVSISGNQIVCPGQTATLTASGATNYTWSPEFVTTPTIEINADDYDGDGGIIPYGGAQTFTVLGTNSSGGCASTATYIVSDPAPSFTVNLNNAVTQLCPGSSYTINTQLGAGVTSYTWNPALTGLSPVITPSVSTDYMLTVSNGTCNSTADVYINVIQTPTVSLIKDVYLCAGQTYSLIPTITIPFLDYTLFFHPGATTYTWNPANWLSSTNTSTTITSPDSSVSYTLIETTDYIIETQHRVGDEWIITTDTMFCMDTSVVHVHVNVPPPIPTINYSALCDSNYTTLYVPSPSSTYTYTWIGPNCYTGTGDSVNVHGTGIYTISVTNSCGVVTTNTINLLVVGNIVAGFETYIHFTFLEEGEGVINSVHFSNLSLGQDLIYNWNFGNGDSSTITNPNEAFNNVGVFNVHLYDSDSLNCKDTASATVVFSGNRTALVIPNSFSPNNDNVDDVFFINTAGVSNFNCQISDKWGNLLYQWNTTSGSWNGKNSSGQVYPNGDYFYLISYTDFVGGHQTRSGIVKLKN